MLTETEQQIRIDLDQFKLHLNIEPKIHLSVHFDTPSRKFYLSVIALVVNEMKSNRDVRSILLKTHQEVLALLNETVGEFAGSSTKGKLIPRIYKKWKSALPDMENAPLFRIVGRKKEYGSGIDKTYICSEDEKDSWANLFEYKGSGENVRLRFSIDAIGASIQNCNIIYKGYADEKAWGQFVADLEKERNAKALQEKAVANPEKEVSRKIVQGKSWRKLVPTAIIVLILVAIGLVSWNLYIWKSQRLEPASLDQMAYPLPEKPSIAVLAFKNMSGDTEQEYFSDGITEEIITALSQNPKLFVIARNSTFKYKGKPVQVQQVSEELGVRYVLEGSVRKSHDTIRITAQLIDAVKGHHLWAERYNRKLDDIFAIQDEITLRIAYALDVELSDGEEGSIGVRGTKNLEAYLKTIQSNEHMMRMTLNDNIRCRQLAQEAIELDPNFDVAWGYLGFSHLFEVFFGWSESPKKSIEKAVEIAHKVDKLGGKLLGHGLWSFIFRVTGKPEKAISEVEKSIAMNPNHAGNHAFLGGILLDCGRPADALVYFQKAMRLNPFYPSWYLNGLGRSYKGIGRYDEAIDAYEDLLQRGDWNLIFTHLGLVTTNAYAGREKQAKFHAKELLKIDPKYNINKFVERFKLGPYKENCVVLEQEVDFLRKAGIPEHSPK